MTGEEFREIRKDSGLTVYQWARALGYQGSRLTVRQQVAKYEFETRPIPPWIANLVTMYARFGVPPDLTVEK